MPEDRKNAKALAEQMAKLSPNDEGTRTFKYVFIPADSSLPVIEKTAVIYSDARGYGDQLMNLLKPNFSEGTVDSAALKRASE